MTRRRDFNPTPNETRHKRVNVLRDCVLKRQPVSGRIVPVSSLALGPALEHSLLPFAQYWFGLVLDHPRGTSRLIHRTKSRIS